MKFRKMSVEMTDVEINRCLSILVEGSEVIRCRRDVKDNSISVRFNVIGDRSDQIYNLILLSDSIVEISSNIPFRADGEYFYRQFMIASGYSEYWNGNMFVVDTSGNSSKNDFKELEQFLSWISDNYDSWVILCDVAYSSMTIEEKKRLFETLIGEGFFTIAYLAIYQSASDSKQMETVRDIIQNKAIAQLPPEQIVSYVKQIFSENT